MSSENQPPRRRTIDTIKGFEALRHQFVRGLGDACWILWIDYKTRIAAGEFPVAMMSYFDGSGLREGNFDLESKILEYRTHVNTNRLSPSELFSSAMGRVFNRKVVYHTVNDIIRGSRGKSDNFLHRTLMQAEQLRRRLPVHMRQEMLSQEISGGFSSGVKSLVQFRLLHRAYPETEGFHTAGIVHVTRVAFGQLPNAQEGIGIHTATDNSSTPNLFKFIDVSNPTHGIRRSQFHEYGYGSGPGCPTTIQPSDECRDYIVRTYGVDPVRTVLFDVRDLVADAMQTYLLEPIPKIFDQYPDLAARVMEYERQLLLGQRLTLLSDEVE